MRFALTCHSSSPWNQTKTQQTISGEENVSTSSTIENRDSSAIFVKTIRATFEYLSPFETADKREQYLWLFVEWSTIQVRWCLYTFEKHSNTANKEKNWYWNNLDDIWYLDREIGFKLKITKSDGGNSNEDLANYLR